MIISDKLSGATGLKFGTVGQPPPKRFPGSPAKHLYVDIMRAWVMMMSMMLRQGTIAQSGPSCQSPPPHKREE